MLLHAERYGHVSEGGLAGGSTSAAQGGDMSMDWEKKRPKRGEDKEDVFIYMKKGFRPVHVIR